MKKIELYQPAIHTIPEDTLVFSMVERNSPEYYKLIMEHYINFMTINIQSETLLRFNNYVNWESINLFSPFFMSRETYQKFEKKLDLIRLLINDGYCLMTFYDKYYISCFPNEHLSHTMVITGYDDKTQMLNCKDYIKRKFIDFRVNYDEYIKSVKNYDFFSIARLGLYGLKIKQNLPPINYSSTYMELQAFVGTNISSENNVGIGVFKTLNNYLDKSRQTGRINTYSWYEISYHLLEGAFLMSERIKYLSTLSKNDFCHLYSVDKKLQQHARMFYNVASKIYMTSEFQQNEYMNVCDLLAELSFDFTEEIKGIIGILETIMIRPYHNDV